MPFDDPADDISEEPVDSDDSGSSEEEKGEGKEDNPSALKWLQESISLGWGTLSRSVNKAVNKVPFNKPFSKRRGKTKDYYRNFSNFLLEENDDSECLNTSTLRENYLSRLAGKLSCILEAEEKLEEEEQESENKIRRRLRKFIKTWKTRCSFKRSDSSLEEEVKSNAEEFRQDEDDANFEFYVRQEKLRRRKEYLQKQRGLLLSGTSCKKIPPTAKEMIPLKTDLQKTVQKQSSPGINKSFSTQKGSTKDEYSNFRDSPIEENDDTSTSILTENYLSTLARKLSFILEAEEKLEEEERARRYKIIRQFRQFISMWKKKSSFRRKSSPIAEEFTDNVDEFPHDMDGGSFEYYVKKEKLRRKKKYVQRQRDSVLSDSTQNKRFSAAATEKLPSETDLQPCKERQSLPRKYVRVSELKTPVKTSTANQKPGCTGHLTLEGESLGKKLPSKVSQANKQTKSSPTPVDISKHVTQEKQDDTDADLLIRNATWTKTLKLSGKIETKEAQKGSKRRPIKVQTDEHTEWMWLALDKEDVGIEIYLPKSVDAAVPQSLATNNSAVAAETIQSGSVTQSTSPKKANIQPDILKHIPEEIIENTYTGIVTKEVVADEKVNTLPNETGLFQNNVRRQLVQQIDSTVEKLKKVRVSCQVRTKDISNVDATSENAIEYALHPLAPERLISEFKDDAATTMCISDRSKTKSKHQLGYQDSLEIDVEFEDGLYSSSRSETENLPGGFAKFIHLFGFSRGIKIASNSEFEGNSAVPPISLLRGNKSFSDVMFKIKLRTARQMRNHNIPKTPLQEPVLPIVVEDADHQNTLLPGGVLIPHVPVKKQNLITKSIIESGAEKHKLANKLPELNAAHWQHIVAVDFQPSDAYSEEEVSLPNQDFDSSFNHTSSFFDLLYKIKWFPGCSKKKLSEEDTPLHEQDYYSSSDYLDKYGIPIPTNSGTIKVEDDFIFERAWNKTANQRITIDESQHKKVVSNALQKPYSVSIQRAELVTTGQSASNQHRRSSKATGEQIVKEGSSSSRQFVDFDPSDFRLKRPKTFMIDQTADKSEVNDDDDDDDDDEESDSDSDDSDSDDSDEEDDDKNDEEELRPRDPRKVAANAENDDPGKTKSAITGKASKIVERIVSMFSLNSTDGIPDSIQVLDIDAVDNMPEHPIPPESIVITAIKPDDSKLDPAFNICVDLKARRKEELTKLLMRATGNKYMTEYFRLEIDKRTEQNDEVANTSKSNPCSLTKPQTTRINPKANKFPDQNQPKYANSESVSPTASSHSTAEIDLPEPKRSTPHQDSESENKKYVVKKAATQRKLSKDNPHSP